MTHDDSYFTIEFLPVNQENCEQAVTVQTLDLLMVFVIHELDGLLFKKLRPISVSYASPIDETEEYERIMRCVLQTGAPRNCIVFDIAYWDERIVTSNYEHQKELLKLAGHNQEAGFPNKSIRERVSSYMLSNSYIKMVNLEDVASNFNTTPRTLQRKLKEESVSFQLLADEARKTLALTYLKDGSFQGKEISFMLGYNELSAFTRTFKRWTGLTPAAYRKKFLQTSEGSEISVH